ncbi:hypothetical protein [Staphylococcus aureus]
MYLNKVYKRAVRSFLCQIGLMRSISEVRQLNIA